MWSSKLFPFILSLQKLSINLEGVGLNRLIGFQASPSRLRKEGGLGVELAEVCVDMMARYTYSTLSTLPSRYMAATGVS